MNEQIQQLRAFVRTVWPYRWPALVLAAVVCAVGWTVVYLLPSQYEVTAKVFVDTRSMLRPLLRGIAVDTNLVQDSALLMRRTLLTRPNLEAVARRTDMDLKAKTPEQFDQMIIDLGNALSISGTTQDNIYQIAYKSDQPKLAKRVVEALLNTFMESTLGDTRVDTASTQKFLDQQIAAYETKLVAAEDRLRDFQRKNMGVMPNAKQDYFGRLQQADQQLADARLQLDEATHRRDELAKQVNGDEPVFGIMESQASAVSSPEIAQLDARLDKLRQSLDDLLTRYTDKHPDVIAIRDQIAKLEADRKKESDKLSKLQAAAPTPLNQNQAYSDLKVQLAAADGDVAALTTRVHEFEKRVADLKKLANTVPEVEAELKRLNRDYGLNKQQYDELVKRREAARISEDVAKSADQVTLKIIEPPKIPLVPTGPDRLRLASIVFVLSLGSGAGLAFLLSQIRPRFYTSQALREFADIPVLGVVTLLQSGRQRAERRMELAMFTLMLLMLVAVFSGLASLDYMNIDIHWHLQALLSRFTGMGGQA